VVSPTIYAKQGVNIETAKTVRTKRMENPAVGNENKIALVQPKIICLSPCLINGVWRLANSSVQQDDRGKSDGIAIWSFERRALASS